MNDRELLELAAKAAGYPISDGHFEEAVKPGAWWGWVYVDGSGEPPNDSAWTELWNPLEDDGDALRLAVKLNIPVIPYDDETSTGTLGVVAKNWQNKEENTRRAIVRAAAEIGRSMK